MENPSYTLDDLKGDVNKAHEILTYFCTLDNHSLNEGGGGCSLRKLDRTDNGRR
jgi:hypothetical protein